MPCIDYDFSVGSRDIMRLLFQDVVIGAKTGKKTKSPIDLENATGVIAWCEFTPATGAALIVREFSVTVDTPQSDPDHTGWTSYQWGLTDLIEGMLRVRGKFTDAGGKPRVTPGWVTFAVGPAPAAVTP